MKGKWKIGSVEIENPFVLAPMAGITDLPFRLLCKEQGAGLLYTEMVSAKAISYHNRNTVSLMETDPKEHPVALQLFGSEPELMGEVAKSIEDQPFDILDINMGCPVPKVVNNGEGSALLKDPALIREIIKAVSGAVRKPVTAKMRIGFEGADVDPVEIARIMEDAGAAAIAVHGRTRQQYYSGRADWETIRRIKEAVSVPVIGNGDVDSPEKAEAMFRETGLRRSDDRPGSAGKSLDLPGDEPLFCHGRASSRTVSGGAEGRNTPPCQDADRKKRRVHRDPGNAEACGLVYGRNEAQRGDPERVESYLFVRGAGKASGAV